MRRWLTAMVPLAALVVLAVAWWWLTRRPPPDEIITPEDYAALSAYDGRLSREGVRAALRRLDPSRGLQPYLALQETHLELRSRLGGPVVVRVRLAESFEPPPGVVDADLDGLRIVLDPGHFGGAWSQIEQRHVVVTEGGPAVREGNLAWVTALLLQQRLRSDGATVTLSRGPPPLEPFPRPPEDLNDAQLLSWLQQNLLGRGLPRWLSERPAQMQLFGRSYRGLSSDAHSFFELYNRFDFRRRADLAAAVRSDIFVSVHYNIAAHPENNKVIVLIPGNFLPDELDQEPNRYYAVRRALEGDGALLETVARNMTRRMVESTGVSARGTRPVAQTANKIIISADEGVYARNLAMLKRPIGPAVLVEGPCMNNPDEHARLLAEDLVVDGWPAPSRTREVAQALHEALRDSARALRRHRGRRAR